MKTTLALFTLFLSLETFGFPTSTVWIPNAQILPENHWRADGRMVFFAQRQSSMTSNLDADIGITYGPLQTEDIGVEVGLDWWEPHPQESFQALHAHGKFTAFETDTFPSFTLGFYNFAFQASSTDEKILYGGIGKTWKKIAQIFVGGFSGSSTSLVDEVFRPAHQGFLVGVSRQMNEISEKLTMAIDFQSSRSSKGALSFGVTWGVPTAKVMLGYNHYLNQKLIQDTLTFQMSTEL